MLDLFSGAFIYHLRAQKSVLGNANGISPNEVHKFEHLSYFRKTVFEMQTV